MGKPVNKLYSVKNDEAFQKFFEEHQRLVNLGIKHSIEQLGKKFIIHHIDEKRSINQTTSHKALDPFSGLPIEYNKDFKVPENFTFKLEDAE